MGQPLIVVVGRTPDQEPDRPAPMRVAAQRRASREALSEAAALAGCPDASFEKSGPRGKPIPTASGWHWSISHDATLVAAVVSPERPMGVDLERIALRRRLLVERVADETERALLGETAKTHLEALGFARLWTAKEAVLKAEQIGLPGLKACKVVGVDGAHQMRLTYGDQPRTVVHTQLDGHLVSLCLHPEEPRGDAPPKPPTRRVVWHLPASFLGSPGAATG